MRNQRASQSLSLSQRFVAEPWHFGAPSVGSNRFVAPGIESAGTALWACVTDPGHPCLAPRALDVSTHPTLRCPRAEQPFLPRESRPSVKATAE